MLACVPEYEVLGISAAMCFAGGLSVTLLKPPTADFCLKIGGLVDVMAVPILKEFVQKKVQVKVSQLAWFFSLPLIVG